MTENKEPKQPTSIALFQEKTVRRVWYQERWFFSVIDVVAILTDSPNPRRYWSDLKRDLEAEGFGEVYAQSVQLKMQAPDGKMRVTDAADTTTLLRIIQSIRSVKAEPFKRWLAEVGSQRLEEIENPEVAMERMRALYEAKGYPKEWIEKRGSWRDLGHTVCLPRRTSPCDIVLSRRILSTPVLPEKRGGDGKNAIASPSRRDAD